MFLRQSTSQVIRFGPCLDKTDGVTKEDGLTLAQADMRLSKDGGAFAQKNASGNATIDEFGWYSTTLDATDTGTVGELIFAVEQPANMLPVWKAYWVVEEAVYDAHYGAAAAGPLQSTTAGRTLDVTATGEAALDLDNTSGTLAAAQIASNAFTADKFAADCLTAAKIAADVHAEAADAVWDEPKAGHVGVTTFGDLATDLDAVLVDTGTTLPALLPSALVGGRMDASVGAMAANVLTATAINADAITAAKVAADVHAETADAVLDEDMTAHQTLGTLGQAIGDPVANTETIYKAVVTDAAGANVAADVVAVKAETASIQAETTAILVDTATTIPASLTTIDTVVDGIQADLDNGTDGLGAIKTETASIQAETTPILVDTADIQPKIGSPSADLAADIAAVKVDTAAILLDTDALTITGTADSGTTTTLVDAALTEGDTDYWKGMVLLITSGTIAGQARRITAFNFTTNTLTVDTAFTQAVGTNTYAILQTAYVEAPAAGSGDWSTAEKEQFRSALGLDGTKTAATGGQLQTIDTVVDGIQTDLSNGTDGLGAIKAETALILADTADMQPKLGAPAGADMSADIAAVKAETVLILADTADIQPKIGTPAADLAADIAAVKVDTAAVLVDTGTTIPALLPSALVGGRMDASVGAMAANVLSASALATDAVAEIADGVWDEPKAGHVGATTFGDLAPAVAAVKAETVLILADTADMQPKLGSPASDVSADIAAVKVDTAAVLVDTADMQPKLGSPAADVSADIAAVKVDTAATLVDTGTTLPALLPAALVGGKMDSDVGNIQTDAIDAASLKTDAVDKIRDAILPKINTAYPDIPVLMVDDTDHFTPKTGLSLTVTRSIDGLAFGAGTGTAAEIGNGLYQYDASAADMNGTRIKFRFVGAAADDRFITIRTGG